MNQAEYRRRLAIRHLIKLTDYRRLPESPSVHAHRRMMAMMNLADGGWLGESWCPCVGIWVDRGGAIPQVIRKAISDDPFARYVL